MNVKKITILVKLFLIVREYYNKFIYSDIFHKRLHIVNNGYLNAEKRIMKGSNNKLIIGKDAILKKVKIIIKGSNNSITIGDRCSIGPNLKLLLEGNNMIIEIGEGTIISHDVELTCQEDCSRIVIGKNSWISHHVNIRTSDSHEIIDLNTQQRINPPKSVYIGERVWITPEAKIMKGVTIGDGSIIGTSSVVTKNIPCFCLAVGMPAKVVKENVTRGKFKIF